MEQAFVRLGTAAVCRELERARAAWEKRGAYAAG
jgi:hypothetical protein